MLLLAIVMHVQVSMCCIQFAYAVPLNQIEIHWYFKLRFTFEVIFIQILYQRTLFRTAFDVKTLSIYVISVKLQSVW